MALQAKVSELKSDKTGLKEELKDHALLLAQVNSTPQNLYPPSASCAFYQNM